jgi:hypothetical protein
MEASFIYAFCLVQSLASVSTFCRNAVMQSLDSSMAATTLIGLAERRVKVIYRTIGCLSKL